VTEWAQQLPGVSSISATIPDDNYPSRWLAKRLGLTRTSETRRGLPLWNMACTQRRSSRADGVARSMMRLGRLVRLDALLRIPKSEPWSSLILTHFVVTFSGVC
jgi:hypothetical protein